jgi:hypothetical protein
VEQYRKLLEQNMCLGKLLIKTSGLNTNRSCAALLAQTKPKALRVDRGLDHFRFEVMHLKPARCGA